LEKAAEHGAQRSVKIKTTWDSPDGYIEMIQNPKGAVRGSQVTKAPIPMGREPRGYGKDPLGESME
jgi:hypothetical protein